MKCPRCEGHILQEGKDLACLNCGWLDTALPEIPADFEVFRRRMAATGWERPSKRMKPTNQGFTSGRPGYCVNGHGFRHSDHQVCMSLKKPVAV